MNAQDLTRLQTKLWNNLADGLWWSLTDLVRVTDRSRGEVQVALAPLAAAGEVEISANERRVAARRRTPGTYLPMGEGERRCWHCSDFYRHNPDCETCDGMLCSGCCGLLLPLEVTGQNLLEAAAELCERVGGLAPPTKVRGWCHVRRLWRTAAVYRQALADAPRDAPAWPAPGTTAHELVQLALALTRLAGESTLPEYRDYQPLWQAWAAHRQALEEGWA